jgi:predicted nucleotidyltransferase
MTDILYNLAGKIDEKTVAILSEIDRIAGRFQLAYFIVGATARDILLQYAHDIQSTRATIDIDIGVVVSDWDQFQGLKQALLDTGKFNLTRQTQRLMYEDEYPVDIVPFGGIAQDDGSIAWPPEHEIKMSVTGFRECYQHAISVIVNEHPELAVKVVSLAGLAILKIVSWDDNSERRGKDAADLFIILRNYIAADHMDRFFEEEGDILGEEGYDYDLSSARFLGREIGKLASPATKEKLIHILEREAGLSKGHGIVMDVLRQDKFQSETYERIADHFNALLRGLSEKKC